MKRDCDPTLGMTPLRAQAERCLRQSPPQASFGDLAAVNHELQINQLELELQNVELAFARDELSRELNEREAVYRAIGHDFAQPLLAARLYLQTLSATMLDDEQRRLVSQLDTTIGAAASLAAGVTALALERAGTRPVDSENVMLAPLLHELVDQHRPTADGKGLRIRVHERVACVRSDARLLRHILNNLISNAVRHTAQGGVLVGARRSGGQNWRVEVWDSGPGIAAGAVAMIFNEFYQVGNHERNPEKGIGLGLSIARHAALRLGASLGLRTVEGRGSVFFVTLPAAPA